MAARKRTNGANPGAAPLSTPIIVEALLAVHSASSPNWVADAASTAAERGLGALHTFLYRTDAAGQLAGLGPASSERKRAVLRVHQALDSDLTALKFNPERCPALLPALQQGHAVALSDLGEALPLDQEAERLQAAQRSLGVEQVWAVPMEWNGERLGLLLLLMPPEPTGSLPLAELLGRHAAVALNNLRQKEAGRKSGELDTVRWVYDEQRFLEQLAQESRRAQRHQRPLSILLLRLANLTDLRTRFGRFLAEQVLHHMSRRLEDTMRDTDFLGAFREDGFAAILVEADRAGAERARERLLENVRATRLPDAELPGMQLHLAAATATLPDDGATAEELTAAAEAHLALPQAREEVA